MQNEQFGDFKFKYRNRDFRCRGYYADKAGKNTAKIQDYIRHQPEADKTGEQLSILYPGNPFTGRKSSKMRMSDCDAPVRALLVREPDRRI